MFRKKTGISADAAAELFHGIRRGTGTIGQPAGEGLLGYDAIANDPSLVCDLQRIQQDQVVLGLVGGVMQKGGESYPAGGLPVGIVDDRPMTTFVGTRGGKTRSRHGVDCLTWISSLLCIDPKGDLATLFARFRSKILKQFVALFDPFGVSGPEAAAFRMSWNPLHLHPNDDENDLIDLALWVADALVPPDPETKDPHWINKARQFLEACIAHVMTVPEYFDRRTLVTVYELIMLKAEDGGPDNPSSLELEMTDNSACAGFIEAGAASYYDMDSRERSGVLSSLRRSLAWIGYPAMRDALADSDADITDLFKGNTTWFVALPATKQIACQGYTRLFVNALLAAAEKNVDRRAYQDQSGGGRVLLTIDEAHSLSRMDRLEAAAGLISGLGIKLHTAWQDLSQIKALYPSWETFLGNSGIINFWSLNDITTLRWIEERLGQTPVYFPSHSNTTYDAAIGAGATGDNYSIGNHPLLSMAEIARLFKRNDPYCRQLVLSASHGPMILQRVIVDKHPTFKALHAAAR